MVKLKIRKNETNKTLIWKKIRYYIDFVILFCCSIIAFNIHPNDNTNIVDISSDNQWIVYIFHDYEWNEYILNNRTAHWSADSRDFLFNNEVPNSIKADKEITYSASLWDNTKTSSLSDFSDKAPASNSLKDNQISIEEIMSNLWLESEDKEYYVKNEDDTKVIDLLGDELVNNNIYYTVHEESWENNSSILTIEKIDSQKDGLLTAKTFAFTSEWWVLPTLLSRDELSFSNLNQKTISSKSNQNNQWKNNDLNNNIEEYANCMTPRWYTIVHWDSVLAYQQIESNPEICNIERRFCWKWKLSGTYTQQWCFTNNSNTTREWWEDTITTEVSNYKYHTKEEWTTNINKPVWTASYVLDKPNLVSTNEYHLDDNIRAEDDDVNQTNRPHRDCTAPWWEKVKHWQFIQAFRHSNGFYDAPCQAQIRFCSMWDLMWTYTQSSCTTWDTSFIDRINGSPTRETYSKEKLERVRKQIIDQQINYEKWLKRFSNSDELEKILTILDS